MSTTSWLSRTVLVGCMLAGCTGAGLSLISVGSPHATSAAAPAQPVDARAEAPAGTAPRARSGDRADLVAWARQAHDTGVDCPMLPAEAELLLKNSNGAEGQMASAIGCMCSVELTCDGYRRESCPTVEPSARLAIHHVGRSERDSEDDRLIARWEDKLFASRNAPLAKVSRATPLPAADRGAYLATVDQRMYIAQLEDDNSKMAEMIAEKLWGSLETYHGHAHAILADLEKRTCGAHSTEARALVAKVDATFAAHRKEIANSERVDRRINSDPLFKRLEAERDSLNKQLAELEHAHGSAGDVCTGSERAGWQICKVAARIDEVNHQINHRIDVLSAGS